jgi:hypothetical protein
MERFLAMPPDGSAERAAPLMLPGRDWGSLGLP